MRANRFQSEATAVPHPDGGVFLLTPMTQLELKKLAKRIVKFDYVTDPRGKTVFNPKGAAIPKFEQDDDVVVDEAMKRITKIAEVGFPVYLGGEQQFDETPEGPRPRYVVIEVDASRDVCDQDHSALEGRCTMRAGKEQRRCAQVVIGDHREIAADLMRWILEGGYEHEVEQDVDEKTEAPADAGAEWHKKEGHTCNEDHCTQKRKKKVKVQQLVAEWAIEEMVKLGEVRRKEQLGN